MSSYWLTVSTFLIYLLLMLALGIYAYRKTDDLSDYILGGRKLGPWVSALSAGASDMSGWLLMGLPGLAYSAGLTALWLAFGLLIGTYLNWLVVAKRLRHFTIKMNNALTIPAYLEERFADKTQKLRMFSAIFILIFFTIYTASGLIAGGKLFASTFHLPYTLAVYISTLAIVSYTLFGGFLAVSWTDVAQGLLMLLALIVVPAFTIAHAGGLDHCFSVLQAAPDDRFLNLFTDKNGSPLSWVAIVSLLAWGLGYSGQPHILARFKAMRSPKEIPYARRIAISWTGLCLLGATLTGLAGISYFTSPLEDAEAVFMSLVHTAFHPAIAGVLLAAILAAVMSTADSQLLVASTCLSEDLYRKWFQRQASEKEAMFIGRIAVILIAGFATLLAVNSENLILEVVAFAWSGFGATFGPVLIFSLYWPRMTAAGALAGLLAGGSCVLLWRLGEGGIFELYEIVPAMLCASLAIVLVSLLTKDLASEAKYHKALIDLGK